MAMQTVTITDWLPTMNANGPHQHWAQARKAHDDDQKTAFWSCKAAGWQKFDERVRVSITLFFPTNRRRDVDNLHYRCKGLIDGLKEFCVDDSTEWMELLIAAQPGFDQALPGVRKKTEIRMETMNDVDD